MNRPENIAAMAGALAQHDITWHVITDQNSPHEFNFPAAEWILHYRCPEHDPPFVNFWDRCNWAMNWFLDTQPLIDSDFYCFLNDDDALEPNYFTKVLAALSRNNWQHSVAITSMERGHQTPTDVVPVRQHPTSKLWGIAENVRLCGIGLEQFVAKGLALQTIRFPYDSCGDGMFIVELVKRNPTVYVPEATVWFNYFEPGRWNR